MISEHTGGHFPQYLKESGGEHPLVAIIGGGPVGSTLACMLKMAGWDVLLFSPTARPALVVGESLVPGTLPILQQIGILDATAAIGTFKPGAQLILDDGLVWQINFADTDVPGCQYAYNVPRKDFDVLFLERAKKLGCAVVSEHALLMSSADGNQVSLSETGKLICAGHFGRQPDLYVDASGRSRALPKLLKLKVTKGGRSDAVLFSHLPNIPTPAGGCIHINTAEYGWIWRIPLPGRTSVGGVFPASYWKQFGSDPEQQYKGFLDRVVPRDWIHAGTPPDPFVASYANYQQRTESIGGENWVLVGDSYGFLDPVFSSGLCLGLTGAQILADELLGNSSNSFQSVTESYQRRLDPHFAVWQELVDSFYDGSFFSMIRTAQKSRSVAQSHQEQGKGTSSSRGLSGVMARLLSGCATESDLSWFRMMRSWCTTLFPGRAIAGEYPRISEAHHNS
jgi:flavin-dependent dehydrogenase